MKSFPVEGDDAKPNSAIKKIQELAFGTFQELSVAPTSANASDLLPRDNDNGYYGSDIYIRLGGQVVKFVGVVVV